MSELTKKELELEINVLSQNIEAYQSLGGDVREYRNQLALFHSQLAALYEAEAKACISRNIQPFR
jgi:hypothetical protein